MKIAISLYGEQYGITRKAGQDYSKDFRDTWSNLERMLINPFKNQGHDVRLYVSCYPIEDDQVRKEFYQLVNPDRMFFNQRDGSTPFTCKIGSFNNIKEPVDFVICMRSDIFLSRILAEEDIDFTKFNFLFPEGRGSQWWGTHRFTCDNIYMWPYSLTPTVEKALLSCCGWPRKNHTDTHGLWLKLLQYIPENEIHFISMFPEPSDLNSFYTINRADVLPEVFINDEVWVKYFKNKPYYFFNY